jgi:hypothetical protein
MREQYTCISKVTNSSCVGSFSTHLFIPCFTENCYSISHSPCTEAHFALIYISASIERNVYWILINFPPSLAELLNRPLFQEILHDV